GGGTGDEAKRKEVVASLDKFYEDDDDDRKDDHVFLGSNAWVGRPSPVPGRLMFHGVGPKDEIPHPEFRKTNKGTTLSLRLTQALRYVSGKGATRDIPAGRVLEDLPTDLLLRTGARSAPF